MKRRTHEEVIIVARESIELYGLQQAVNETAPPRAIHVIDCTVYPDSGLAEVSWCVADRAQNERIRRTTHMQKPTRDMAFAEIMLIKLDKLGKLK